MCNIQVGCQHKLKYMHVRTLTCRSPLRPPPPRFLLHFSSPPAPPPFLEKLRPREDGRHRKTWAELPCAFKPKCPRRKDFCLSIGQSIVDISFYIRIVIIFKQRCHRKGCPIYSLAGLKASLCGEGLWASCFPPGMMTWS